MEGGCAELGGRLRAVSSGAREAPLDALRGGLSLELNPSQGRGGTETPAGRCGDPFLCGRVVERRSPDMSTHTGLEWPPASHEALLESTTKPWGVLDAGEERRRAAEKHRLGAADSLAADLESSLEHGKEGSFC